MFEPMGAGDRTQGRQLMTDLITAASTGVPTALTEPDPLARARNRRAADLLAHVDRPRPSDGPTEAIDGRLEHLEHLGGFRPQRHPRS